MTKKTERIQIPPDPSLKVSLQRSGHDLNTAVSDIIDNSIDAQAKKIEVNIDLIPVGDNEVKIEIIDDGTGMDRETLIEAMKYGTSKKGESAAPQTLDKRRKKQNSLGKFGLGLKTASSSQCDIYSVYTRYIDPTTKKVSNGLKATADIFSNNWEISLQTDLEASDQDRFISKNGPGTIVVWEKCNRIIKDDAKRPESSLTRAVNDLKWHLSVTFEKFLDKKFTEAPNLEIYLKYRSDIESLKPINPFAVSEEGTDKSFPKQNFQVTKGAGKLITEFTFKPYVLPYHLEFDDNDVKDDVKPNLNTLQGCWFYRNHRLIHYGGWLDLYAMDNKYNPARIEFCFDESLDNFFEIDFIKKTILLNDSTIGDAVKKHMQNPINVAKSLGVGRAKKNRDKKAEQLHKSSNTVLQEKSETLVNYKVSVDKDQKAILTNKHGTMNTNIIVLNDPKPGEISIKAVGASELPDTPSNLYAHTFSKDKKDGSNKPTVLLNKDHAFYSKVYIPNSDDRVTIQGLDYLFWALINAELESQVPEQQELMKDLRRDLSMTLEKLTDALPDPEDTE